MGSFQRVRQMRWSGLAFTRVGKSSEHEKGSLKNPQNICQEHDFWETSYNMACWRSALHKTQCSRALWHLSIRFLKMGERHTFADVQFWVLRPSMQLLVKSKTKRFGVNGIPISYASSELQPKWRVVRPSGGAHFRHLHCHKTTGWWFQPLWKILVNWDDYSKYMRK